MRSTGTMEMYLSRRVASLVAIFALVSSLILPTRPLQASALAARAEAFGAGAEPVAARSRTAEEVREAYGKVEMGFEENRGQTADEVKYLARGAGYTVFLTATEAVFALREPAPPEAGGGASGGPGAADSLSRPDSSGRREGDPARPRVLRMKVEGANPQAEAQGLEKLPGIVNYFVGSDPEKWRTEIPTFSRVHYAGVYPGVDLVYYGNQRRLEYDFVVGPGADHSRVSLSFEGADSLEVEGATGDLLLKVGGQVVRQHKPFVYQEAGGARREVESSYTLKGGGRVGFSVGEYDRARPLVIDPVLAYSTYLGGGGEDSGRGIAVDAAGNAYVAGQTASANFPVANAIQAANGGTTDAFVTKLNASGSALVYSTYLGGNGADFGYGIAVDSAGSAYVTGSTLSTNFPVANAFQAAKGASSDAFVTKLNAAGSALVYSTHVGGGSLDTGKGIAVDSAGNAYVTGETLSTNFPVSNAIQSTNGLSGFFDAFVVKLNASGSALVYSTYLGGGNDEFGAGIAVDAAGRAHVTGRTASANFPVANAFQAANGGITDAFVTKLNPAGSAFVYSTYLGGSGPDYGVGIAVDAAGSAYVTGAAFSTNFPVANAIQATNGGADSFDAFVTKFNPAGSALVYSTYLGGGNDDFGAGIAVDAAGRAHVTGQTDSANFPVANAFQATYGASADAFVAQLNAAGSALAYSTYLGGSGFDTGRGIAADSAGSAYVTGQTNSTNFPATPEAFQPGKDAGLSAFVSKVGSYLIAGRAVDAGGNPVAGVTVTLSGSSSATTTTDANGNFLFLDTVAFGSYSVTPSREGLTFNPSSFGIGNLNTNVPDIIFAGTAAVSTTPTPVPTPVPTPTPATFQFSAASFGVSEGAGYAQITVTRAGDATSAADVDYATSDGTASDRGDYTTAIGRLRFNAGETARSFQVFITDDRFAEGNETVQIALSNPSAGAQVGGSSTVTLTIVDNEAVTASTNPIDETAFFVRQHYVDFLGREPDPTGFAHWTNNIESCGADASCREGKRIDTSAAFFLSIEFQQTGFLVHRATRAAFNRLPRYREFIRDTTEIGRGVVVGQAGWEARLEANKQAFFDEFVTRAEFAAIYGGLSNEQYVDALNANTGGSLSAAERNALVAGLNAGTETRATVLRKVAEDADFAAQEFNPAFVLMQYFGYLRRNPDDPPDSDFSGYDFWLAKLNSFGGDFRRAEMVKAFLVSAEYRGRFGQP